MRCRRHNYVYTQGYFYCTKCGHRRYHSHRGRRSRNKKIIIVPVIVVLVGIVAYFYSDIITNFSNKVPQAGEMPTNIPIPTQEEISKAIEKTSESVAETISSVTTVSELDTQATALKIHELINEQRAANSLKQLGWNPKLEQAAVNHSQDMATRNYFAHDSPSGSDFSDRYRSVGLNCEVPMSSTMYATGAENIFYLEGYYGEDRIAQVVVNGWMDSAGHKKNILTPYFVNEGIGVAVSDSGKIYVTENFC